jgi:hypothetical protein
MQEEKPDTKSQRISLMQSTHSLTGRPVKVQNRKISLPGLAIWEDCLTYFRIVSRALELLKDRSNVSSTSLPVDHFRFNAIVSGARRRTCL